MYADYDHQLVTEIWTLKSPIGYWKRRD